MTVFYLRICRPVQTTIYLELLGFLFYSVYGLENFINMRDHCGEVLDIGNQWHGDIGFSYQTSLTAPSTVFECYTDLQARGKWVFYFTKFELNPPTGTCHSFVQTAAGDRQHTIIGLDNILCQSRSVTLQRRYYSPDSGLFLRVVVDIGKLLHDDIINLPHFSIDINLNLTFTIDTVSCAKSEFHCDNGKCIPEEWACSGGDPCGDGSDCDENLQEDLNDGLRPEIIGAICGCVIMAVLLLGPLVYVIWKKRKSQTSSMRASAFNAFPRGSLGRQGSYSREDNSLNGPSLPEAPRRASLDRVPSYNTLFDTDTVVGTTISPDRHQQTQEGRIFSYGDTLVTSESQHSTQLNSDGQQEELGGHAEAPPSYDDVISNKNQFNVSPTFV